jgi:hypothetical protein
MNWAFTRRLVLPALAVGIIAVVMAWAFNGNTVRAQPAPPNIDWSASSTQVGLGASFSVTITGDTGAGNPVNTYQWEIAVPAGLSYSGGSNLATGTFPSCFVFPAPAAGPTAVTMACGHGGSDADFTPSANLDQVDLACGAAPGSYVLHMTTFAEDSVSGTTWIAATGPIDTNTGADITIDCVAVSDISVVKTGPGTVAADTPFVYDVTATNNGPQAAIGLVVGDTLPDIADGDGRGMKVIDGPITVDLVGGPAGLPCLPGFIGVFPNPFPPPAFFNSTVACSMPIMATVLGVPTLNNLPAGGSVVVHIPVTAPLVDAGKVDFNIAQANLDCSAPLGDPACTLDNNPANEADCVTLAGPLPPANLGCDASLVLPANVTISKSGSPDPAKDGDTITWTVSVDNAAGGSAAGSPVGEGGGDVSNCWDNLDNDANGLIDADGGGVGLPDPACGNFGPVITDDVEDSTTSAITSATISVGNCLETGTPSAQILDATGQSNPDVICSMDAPLAAGTSAVLSVDSVAVAPSVTTCNNDATVSWADPGTASATGSVGCQPKGVVEHKDKGVAVFPQVLDVLVGSHAQAIVAETLEIVVPGPTPNLVMNWTATSPAGDGQSIQWVAESGSTHPNGVVESPDVVTPAAPSDVGSVDTWQLSNLPTGLITVSRSIDVSCSVAGNETTINFYLDSVGAQTVRSTGSLVVQCFDQPQEVKVPDQGNLWLMRHPNCGPENLLPPCNPDLGKGAINIQEVASGIANGHNDPGGLGAYEKQIKFDHKLFKLTVSDSGYLGSTGRSVNCTMTIVTENWIMFGCVSTGTMDGPTNPGPVTLTNILVQPQPDLFLRIHPTKNNGVVSTIIDENCEWSDILGNPMAGTVNGGLVPVCGSSTLTVRMLEGDLNNDCNVDVLDEQAIAYRYGATFGLQSYNSYFDLQPDTGDFDIDIKDLQFVFGRDGSTCDSPIPAQLPLAPPP